ncbi:hypothetical protein LTR08_005126 [Meristemomyces frigidus]|nr:hypothetical protein LTR08_005126 [Meristemomyces frigidus]
MERPPSQIENARPSGIKQPSRLPAMTNGTNGRTLLETSASDINARSTGGYGGLMGPPNGTVKHKMQGLPEPVPKRKTSDRKTLAERGGEPFNATRSHLPATKPSYTRSDSNTAQVGSRVPSSLFHGYRNASNASTASSVSSVRTPNRQNAARHARMPSAPEPTTVKEEDDYDEGDSGIMGKRKGTHVPLSHNTLNLRKTRTIADLRHSQQQPASMSAVSQHSASYIRSCSDGGESEQSSRVPSTTSTTSLYTQQKPLGESTRSTSLNTAFADLSLTPRKPSLSKHRPSLERIKKEVSPSKIPKFSCTPTLRHTQSQQTLYRTPSPPKHHPHVIGLYTPRTSVRRTAMPVFLTKDALTPVSSFTAWDTKGRLLDMESMYQHLQSQVASAAESKNALDESLDLYKTRVQELTQLNLDLTASNRSLATDIERLRSDFHTTTTDLRLARRDHERDLEDARRSHDKELADASLTLEKALQERQRDAERFKKTMEEAEHKWQRLKDDETADMTTAHWDELEEERAKYQREKAVLQKEVEELRLAEASRATESATEVQDLRNTVAKVQNLMEVTNATVLGLRARISAEESRNAALEAEKTGFINKMHFLEGNQEAQSLEFTTMSRNLADAITAKEDTLATLRKEEMQRRKLNATILELRGNIRVFVRTRPLLADEADTEVPARVEYPDSDSLDGGKEMVVHAPTTLSATGKERNEKHAYAFDRVYGPATQNTEVFADVRDLVQSVVDGFNVSILSYGQTGSGKTFGMSGPGGIIPCSIELLLEEIARLAGKGWEYVVEASFVEVYNECLNDLLGDARAWDVDEGAAGGGELGASVRGGGSGGRKKERHEIRHDPVTGKTSVTNLSKVVLWPPPPAAPLPTADEHPTSTSTSTSTATPETHPPPSSHPPDPPSSSYTHQTVQTLLSTAAKNRRVAATNSNARSSRSHSVFMLSLRGACAATGESSEGVLNLVDLAGSERLKVSGAEGGRARETAAINRSLSCLGDVVASLGAGGGKGGESHVPYRNSKLTYLLQASLGGTAAAAGGKSSRTLMLLHLSPLQGHWQESRSSLVFGSKVHGTHIGAAKKR